MTPTGPTSRATEIICGLPGRSSGSTSIAIGRCACLHLVWVLSHLAADGGGILLLLADLVADETGTAKDPRHPNVLDISRSEQMSQLRQLSSRTMRYWESQLMHIPPQTFGG